MSGHEHERLSAYLDDALAPGGAGPGRGPPRRLRRVRRRGSPSSRRWTRPWRPCRPRRRRATSRRSRHACGRGSSRERPRGALPVWTWAAAAALLLAVVTPLTLLQAVRAPAPAVLPREIPAAAAPAARRVPGRARSPGARAGPRRAEGGGATPAARAGARLAGAEEARAGFRGRTGRSRRARGPAAGGSGRGAVGRSGAARRGARGGSRGAPVRRGGDGRGRGLGRSQSGEGVRRPQDRRELPRRGRSHGRATRPGSLAGGPPGAAAGAVASPKLASAEAEWQRLDAARPRTPAEWRRLREELAALRGPRPRRPAGGRGAGAGDRSGARGVARAAATRPTRRSSARTPPTTWTRDDAAQKERVQAALAALRRGLRPAWLPQAAVA